MKINRDSLHSSFKPRHPLVAPAHFRHAGSHRPGVRATRRAERRMLQRELDPLKQHSP